MPAEAPFLFSVAAMNVSLAGLAGLVAALRRNTGLRSRDLYRLREIVEFSFANALLAISIVPAATILGGLEPAIRVASVVATAYVVVNIGVLYARNQRAPVATPPLGLAAIVALNVAAVLAGLAGAASGGSGAYGALLVVLLARPMLAFVLVLADFDVEPAGAPTPATAEPDGEPVEERARSSVDG